VYPFVRGKDLAACAIAERFDVDGITVIVVEDEEVVVASTGRCDETSGLIGVNLPSDRSAGGVQVVCARAKWVGGWRRVIRV
jgi:hypothetical protein